MTTDFKLMFSLFFIIAFVVALLTGCTSTYVTYDRFAPDGKTRVSTLSVHRRTAASRVSMPTVKFNPDGTAELAGYENDGGNGMMESAIKAAVKSAVEAAASAVVPGR